MKVGSRFLVWLCEVIQFKSELYLSRICQPLTLQYFTVAIDQRDEVLQKKEYAELSSFAAALFLGLVA